MAWKSDEARREYHKKYMKDRYYNDPVFRAQHLKNVLVSDKKRRSKYRETVKQFKQDGCIACVEKELCCLVAHHLDPSKKSFAVSQSAARVSLRRLKEELEKCVCLCMNCHAKVHAGKLKPPAATHGGRSVS